MQNPEIGIIRPPGNGWSRGGVARRGSSQDEPLSLSPFVFADPRTHASSGSSSSYLGLIHTCYSKRTRSRTRFKNPEYHNAQVPAAHKLLTRYAQGSAPITMRGPASSKHITFNPKQTRNKFEFHIERTPPHTHEIEKTMGPKDHGPLGRSILRATRSYLSVN